VADTADTADLAAVDAVGADARAEIQETMGTRAARN
jgi:hypothetical protein